MTIISQSIRENNDRLDLIKIENYWSAKDVKRVKRQTTDWEKKLLIIYAQMGKYLEYIKNSQNSEVKDKLLT